MIKLKEGELYRLETFNTYNKNVKYIFHCKLETKMWNAIYIDTTEQKCMFIGVITQTNFWTLAKILWQDKILVIDIKNLKEIQDET